MRQFKQWLRELVLAWRREVAALPPEDGLPDSGPIFRFYAPCQIDIIHLQHTQHRLDFRLCIISHFNEEPDLTIRFIGHYYPDYITQAIDDYVHRPRWQRPLPEPDKTRLIWGFGEEKTYSDALSHAIVNAYGPVRTYLNNTIQSKGIEGRSFGMVALPGSCFAWGIAGRIERFHPDTAAYAGKEVHRELKKQEHQGLSTTINKTAPMKHGLGAFLLPPVWIGEAPTITVKEYLDGTHPEIKGHQKVVGRLRYKGYQLFVTQSGFFCVDIEDRQEAAQIVNELFATTLFFGYPATTVAPTDLILVNNVETPLAGYTLEGKVNREQSDRLCGEPPWRSSFQRTTVLDIEKIEEIVRWSEQTSSESTKALVMQLCLDAWSYFHRREYRSAFLTAWTVCELTCDVFWERYLTAQDVTGKIKNELLRWDVNRILEMLLTNKMLSEEYFHQLDKARVRRNQVLHRGWPVTRESAQQIVNLTMRLVSEHWELPLPRDLMANLVETH